MSSTVAVPSITDAEFASAIAQGVVAVDFTAEWCPPCRMMAPIVEQAAKDYAGSIRILQMDTDANPATMAKLGVRSMPTVVVFRDGEIVDRIIGAWSPTIFRRRLDAVLAPKLEAAAG
ncbi:MAG TPA: thioredoxin domain-containing protein [Gemmatimonadaceae bacterium]|jgi:thioredoxin 1